MTKFKIVLEDKTQDFTRFITDENGVIIEALPFQTDFWKGATIPLEMQNIGDLCMIHHPPYIEYGYLKYKVTQIQKIM